MIGLQKCSSLVRSPYRLALLMFAVSLVSYLIASDYASIPLRAFVAYSSNTKNWSPNNKLQFDFSRFVQKQSLHSGHNVNYGQMQNLSSSRTKKRTQIQILFWNQFFSYDIISVFKTALNRCQKHGIPVTNLILTDDHSELSKAHAVVYHGPNTYLWQIPIPRPPNAFYVYYSKESTIRFQLQPQLWKYFQWTATVRRDSDYPEPYGRFKAMPSDERRFGVFLYDTISNSTEAERLQRWNQVILKKTKLVAWIVSHCWTESRREEYVKELQKYIQVDVFGKCSSSGERCEGDCFRNISHYKFYLAFENSVCTDYVTEKVFARMDAPLFTVPIVLSQHVAENVLPGGSFIAADNFPHGPAQLAEYLLKVAGNHSLYLQYFEWRKTYKLTEAIPSVCLLYQKLEQLVSSKSSFDAEIRRLEGRNLSYFFDPAKNCIKSFAANMIPNNGGDWNVLHQLLRKYS